MRVRLGPHVQNHGVESQVRAWVTRCRPPVVKFLADALDPDLMRWCQAQGCKVVLRKVADPLKAGATGSRLLRDQVLSVGDGARGCFDYLEAANEEMQGRDRPADIDDLSALMLGFMRDCDARGYKACVFNFSVGQPELELWSRPKVVEALDYAGQHSHVIGMHEYYKPVPWQGVDNWDDIPNAAGWWMLRLTRHLKEWHKLRLAKLPQIVVTESGRDDISGTPGGGKGWRDEPTTPDGDYADFMAAYCLRLSAHPEVLGCVDFGFGAADRNWESFDLSKDTVMLERMMTVMAAPVTPPTPPAPPTPVPTPAADNSVMRGMVATRQVIFPNPSSGLQVAMKRDAFAPLTDELHDDARKLVFQGAYLPGITGQERVYFSRAGGAVQWIPRAPEPVVVSPVLPPVEAAPGIIEGVDVSHYQGLIRWSVLRSNGIRFAWIKSSEGRSYVDPQYTNNARGATEAGVLFGAYFYYKNGVNALEQANNLSAVVAAGPRPTLPIAIDLEDTTAPLSESQLRAFVNLVTERFGKPVIYSGKWWLDRWPNADLRFLAAYPLWLAAYRPTWPVGPQPWQRVTVHQYTSSGDGRALGVESENVDRDRFLGSIAQLVDLGK